MILTALVLVALILIGCTGGGGSTPQTYFVYGKVTDGDGNGIPGVLLHFSSGFGVAETDEDGKWSKGGLHGSVEITLEKDGWFFEPKTVTKSEPDIHFVGEKLAPPGSIQAAIDAAQDGDVVTIAPGTYFENLNFKGKNITLTSVDPQDPDVVSATIIDGGGKYAAIVVQNVETEAVITGFTITHGNRGVVIRNSAVTLTHNVIKGNSAPYSGGGVYIDSRLPCVIEYNTISENRCIDYGGGLHVQGGTHTITGNTVSGNYAGQMGGGLYFWEGSWGRIGNTHTITGNTVSENSAGRNGGGLYFDGGTHTITGNTVSENSAGDNGGGLYFSGGTHTITENMFIKNSADASPPLFVSKGGGGIYIGRATKAILMRNAFHLNTTKGKGGAVLVVGSESMIVDDEDKPLLYPDTLNEYMDNTPGNIVYQ